MKSRFRVLPARKASGDIVETVKTIVYAVAIAFIIRTVAYEPFNIPSGSMEPTLLVGDYLFVSKFSYGYSRYSLPFGPNLFSGRISLPISRMPERGDVAVFKLPTDPSTDYIKRIVGLPGDTLEVRGGNLLINGVPVPRRPDANCSLPSDPRSQGFIESLPRGPGEPTVDHCIAKSSDFGIAYRQDLNNTPVYKVPANHYFMMGDNRDHSQDSRVLAMDNLPAPVGYVPAENLVGKAQFIFFSTDGWAQWWEVWKWPFTVRYGRLFGSIH